MPLIPKQTNNAEVAMKGRIRVSGKGPTWPLHALMIFMALAIIVGAAGHILGYLPIKPH